jgi:hypothetical protein
LGGRVETIFAAKDQVLRFAGPLKISAACLSFSYRVEQTLGMDGKRQAKRRF